MEDFYSIAEDNLTDIAQYNPHLRLYLDEKRREHVEEQLGDVRMMLYEWEGEMSTHRAIDIIELALVKGQDWIVYRIMDTLGFDNLSLNKFVIYNAALNSRKDVINYMAENGVNDWNSIAEAAAKLGDLDTIKEIAKNERFSWKGVIINAAINGFVDIIEYVLSNYETDNLSYSLIAFNAVLNAAYGGHRDLVFDMIRKDTSGSISYGRIAGFAARGGRVKLLDEMIRIGNIKHLPIADAAEGGHRELVFDLLGRTSMVHKGKINRIAYHASRAGHMDIVEDMLDGYKLSNGMSIKASDYNWIAEGAAESGSTDLLYEMVKRGANNWKKIAKAAAKAGYKTIVSAMLDAGVDLSTLRFNEHGDAKLYFKSS